MHKMRDRQELDPETENLADAIEPIRSSSARELLESTGVRIHGFVDSGEGIRYSHDPALSSLRALSAFRRMQEKRRKPEQDS